MKRETRTIGCNTGSVPRTYSVARRAAADRDVHLVETTRGPFTITVTS